MPDEIKVFVRGMCLWAARWGRFAVRHVGPTSVFARGLYPRGVNFAGVGRGITALSVQAAQAGL